MREVQAEKLVHDVSKKKTDEKDIFNVKITWCHVDKYTTMQFYFFKFETAIKSPFIFDHIFHVQSLHGHWL